LRRGRARLGRRLRIGRVADARSALRRQLRERRAALPPRERVQAAAAIVEVLEQIPEFLVDPRIAGYWAVGGEIPLNIVQMRLASREQRWFLPRLHSEGSLGFAAWQAGAALAPNRFGIPEPAADAAPCAARELDVVLLPLLAFDRKGNRLGMGAGYYDRTFAWLRDRPRPAQPLLVGIGYHFQEVPALAAQPWDVPLDYIATERELIACVEPAAPLAF